MCSRYLKHNYSSLPCYETVNLRFMSALYINEDSSNTLTHPFRKKTSKRAPFINSPSVRCRRSTSNPIHRWQAKRSMRRILNKLTEHIFRFSAGGWLRKTSLRLMMESSWKRRLPAVRYSLFILLISKQAAIIEKLEQFCRLVPIIRGESDEKLKVL